MQNKIITALLARLPRPLVIWLILITRVIYYITLFAFVFWGAHLLGLFIASGAKNGHLDSMIILWILGTLLGLFIIPMAAILLGVLVMEVYRYIRDVYQHIDRRLPKREKSND